MCISPIAARNNWINTCTHRHSIWLRFTCWFCGVLVATILVVATRINLPVCRRIYIGNLSCGVIGIFIIALHICLLPDPNLAIGCGATPHPRR